MLYSHVASPTQTCSTATCCLQNCCCFVSLVCPSSADVVMLYVIQVHCKHMFCQSAIQAPNSCLMTGYAAATYLQCALRCHHSAACSRNYCCCQAVSHSRFWSRHAMLHMISLSLCIDRCDCKFTLPFLLMTCQCFAIYSLLSLYSRQLQDCALLCFTQIVSDNVAIYFPADRPMQLQQCVILGTMVHCHKSLCRVIACVSA